MDCHKNNNKKVLWCNVNQECRRIHEEPTPLKESISDKNYWSCQTSKNQSIKHLQTVSPKQTTQGVLISLQYTKPLLLVCSFYGKRSEVCIVVLKSDDSSWN